MIKAIVKVNYTELVFYDIQFYIGSVNLVSCCYKIDSITFLLVLFLFQSMYETGTSPQGQQNHVHESLPVFLLLVPIH